MDGDLRGPWQNGDRTYTRRLLKSQPADTTSGTFGHKRSIHTTREKYCVSSDGVVVEWIRTSIEKAKNKF